MKTAILLIGLGAMAATVSFGVAQIEAQQTTLLNFCPPQAATDCSTAAAMLVAVGKPTDDQIVAYVNAIADAAGQHPLRGKACKDTADGLGILAAAIDKEATRSLVEQVAASLCQGHAGFFGGGDSGDVKPWPTGADTSTKNQNPAPDVLVASSSSSGQSSGSSGQTSSGASGNTSSGASGNTSGGASGTSGQTSSGASGNTSSGASGNTSGGTSGTSGQTSSGASGNTSSGGGLGGVTSN